MDKNQLSGKIIKGKRRKSRSVGSMAAAWSGEKKERPAAA